MGAYGQFDVTADTDGRVTFPRLIVPSGALIHSTSGLSSLPWLQGESAKAGRPASADYLVARDGRRYKITAQGLAAYHAGKSVAYIQGRRFVDDNVSAVLVGVELEQYQEQQITYEQFDSLAELIVQLSDVFGWRWPYTILGHYEVARPLGRRSDPVNFPWGDFMGRLYIHAKDAGISGL